ncbi:AAA domain-containing protein [Maridesulfovibrio salexigens]|uniref:Superfamily I DNA and RNA helicase and helicase subunit-like protein n=1 Tax=Maridesulfovibrio salexigens (strain ATCC 14822 / DSM 2638 / NCIMB 8403 / VKM B-1763) TaxID=526222 RepID=C6BT16_MARSD|nr:AAA domain-containing protein [Maridesulfovibrio salexigens]ACS79720.1 Superfamily I DNA and RNA helicase and helicase subunit-like protein [Maridesulfovibrio salexigens DSM 2638]
MSFEYEEVDEAKIESNGWSHQRAWQIRSDSESSKIPVMVHELCTDNVEHELLIRRYFEEVQRILFKASNLPEAKYSTICLERHFSESSSDDLKKVYKIVTKGWYTASLEDLFSSNGKLKAMGEKQRNKLRAHSERARFWNSISNIAQFIRRLQQNKLFCPKFTLESFYFVAETSEEFALLESGQDYPFELLRLTGLENIVPFGGLVRENSGSRIDPSHQIFSWHALAGIIVDILLGPPSSSIKCADKIHAIREDKLKHGLVNNKISDKEYSLLQHMFHAQDSFSLGDVCRQIEVLSHALPIRRTASGRQSTKLSVVYSEHARENFVHLVNNEKCEYGEEPSAFQVSEYLRKRLSRAEVWFDSSQLDGSYSEICFDCGGGLRLSGMLFKDLRTDEVNKKLLFLNGHYCRGGLKENCVRFYDVEIDCFYIKELRKRTTSSSGEWGATLARCMGFEHRKHVKDQQLSILSTLELANQLESLMAFLTLFVCEVKKISNLNDGVEILLSPLSEEALYGSDSECREHLNKIRDIQTKVRSAISQNDNYADVLFRNLQDQFQQYAHLPEAKRKHADILITTWKDAGSLSINIGAGSANLDQRSWRIDWEHFFTNKDSSNFSIKASRKADFDLYEKSSLVVGKLVSLRTRGHYGQMEVVKRRTDAFEHLRKYDMLMQQLVEPGRKTGQLPRPSNNFRQWAEEVLYDGKVDPSKRLDDNKMAIIEDIYRTMPMFVLQGPPGTGKSETVCTVVKLIFSEDPMAQVLLTSRENATVKELLRKLYKESQSWEDKPIFKLSPNIQNSLRGEHKDTGDSESFSIKATISEQTLALLDDAYLKMKGTIIPNDVVSSVCNDWRLFLTGIKDGEDGSVKSSDIENINYLLEQSASLIFTTASDKGLADMVASGDMYDWVFVEEAAKTPFYDLLLPMLVSQRWVLLGDSQQLNPFWANEFMALMNNYTSSIKMLKEVKLLGQTGRKDYISIENIEKVLARKEDSRFFESEWIWAFRKLFAEINPKFPDREEANGETAAVLNTVYRMPPALTGLVNVFYDTELVPAPMTQDMTHGELAPSGIKSNPLSAPNFLTGVNGIWVDTGRGEVRLRQQEEKNQVCNPGEAKLIRNIVEKMEINGRICKKPSLAILTPYRKQVSALKAEFRKINDLLLEKFTPVIMRRNGGVGWVSTIDSFQGCQADVVILSLVRNSTSSQYENKQTIQFVTDENRVNVMISRAQRFLVVVGSFEYFMTCYNSSADHDLFYKFLQNFRSMAEDFENRYLAKIFYSQIPAEFKI